MRLQHGKVDVYGMADGTKSSHLAQRREPRKGNWQMFVRAVWRLKRLVDIKQTLREMEVPTTRDALGLSGADFQKMTRGLFDR